MVITRLYTDKAYSDNFSIESLINFLFAISPLEIRYFGYSEPVQEIINRQDLSAISYLLTNSSEHQVGEILLKSNEFNFLVYIRNRYKETSDWIMYIDDDYFDLQERTIVFKNFLINLCIYLDALFCGTASQKEWKDKHEKKVEVKQGVMKREKVGLSIVPVLSGIYWLTIGRKDIFDKLNIEKLFSSNLCEINKIDQYGYYIMVSNSPLSVEEPNITNKIIDILGAEFFFNIQRD